MGWLQPPLPQQQRGLHRPLAVAPAVHGDSLPLRRDPPTAWLRTRGLTLAALACAGHGLLQMQQLPHVNRAGVGRILRNACMRMLLSKRAVRIQAWMQGENEEAKPRVLRVGGVAAAAAAAEPGCCRYQVERQVEMVETVGWEG